MSQTEVSRAAIAAHSSSSGLQRTAPDYSPSGSWQSLRRAQAAAYREGRMRGAPALPGLLIRAALALVVTTVLVRVAWTLLV